jgi:hypothetical protein
LFGKIILRYFCCRNIFKSLLIALKMDKLEERLVDGKPQNIRFFNPFAYMPFPVLGTIGLCGIAGLTLKNSYPTASNTSLGIGCFLLFGSLFSRACLSNQKEKIRPFDFQRQFGLDPYCNFEHMSKEERQTEISRIVEILNDNFVPYCYTRKEVARKINLGLTDYIEGNTGQRISTSSFVKSFSLLSLIFPQCVGGSSSITGEVTCRNGLGVLEPAAMGHELVHRKGYLKELEANIISYFYLVSSGDPSLVQSGESVRLLTNLCLSEGKYRDKLEKSGLRGELKREFLRIAPPLKIYQRLAGKAFEKFYGVKMRLTGQRGLDDYSTYFTDYLHLVRPI